MSYFITAELSAFLGVPADQSLQRHEIEHKILTYVKEQNLVKPENKMVFRTDPVLEELMNGKAVFSGFSIIPYLKHHLVATDAMESSQGDQLTENSNEEETCEEESSSTEETEPVMRGIALRNPYGEELIFERGENNHICIQNRFVVSHEEFRNLVNTLCPEEPFIPEKQDNPYEMIAFLLMFLITLLTFSLWVSIMNESIRSMA